MSHPVKGIDHCYALVNDLDDAAAQYAALGFTLSPRGLHSAAKGSANHTIMFPDDYYELLGLLHPTEANAPRRRALREQGQGLHALACRIDDAAAGAEALAALGIGTHGLGSFERPVTLPGGGSGVAAFSTVEFDLDEVPLGIVFMCQHKTRQTVWIAELLRHPNTACGLGPILVASQDPPADAARFARLWAGGAVSRAGDVFTVDTGPGSAPLLLMSEPALAKMYPGIDLAQTARGAFAGARIRVADIGAATTCVEAAGITPVATRLGFAVEPRHAAGVLLEFVAS